MIFPLFLTKKQKQNPNPTKQDESIFCLGAQGHLLHLLVLWRHCCLAPVPSKVQWERQRMARTVSEVDSMGSGPSMASSKGFWAVFWRLSLCHTVLCFLKAGSRSPDHLLKHGQEHIDHCPCLGATGNDHKSHFSCTNQWCFTNSLCPHTLFLLPQLLFLPAVLLVGLQMTAWADGLEAHTTNMQWRTIHESALLQLPGSAEMSKTCYSPFGNMLWLLINANSLLSTVIHNYFSVTKCLTTISTSSSGAKSIS